MTISIRNNWIPTAAPKAPRNTRASLVVAPRNAVRTLREAQARRRSATIRYEYALTPIDVVFDAASESAETSSAHRRTARQDVGLLLAIGTGMVVVVTMAVALLLTQMVHVTSALLS
jgi:hypothetical protein